MLMACQAFCYNGVFFTYALVLTKFYGVPARDIGILWLLNTSCPSGPQQGDPACKHPVLGDPRVRRAIDLAIDRKALVDELLSGKTSVATSVLPLGPYAVQLPRREPDRTVPAR